MELPGDGLLHPLPPWVIPGGGQANSVLASQRNKHLEETQKWLCKEGAYLRLALAWEKPCRG